MVLCNTYASLVASNHFHPKNLTCTRLVKEIFSRRYSSLREASICCLQEASQKSRFGMDFCQAHMGESQNYAHFMKRLPNVYMSETCQASLLFFGARFTTLLSGRPRSTPQVQDGRCLAGMNLARPVRPEARLHGEQKIKESANGANLLHSTERQAFLPRNGSSDPVMSDNALRWVGFGSGCSRRRPGSPARFQ